MINVKENYILFYNRPLKIIEKITPILYNIRKTAKGNAARHSFKEQV